MAMPETPMDETQIQVLYAILRELRISVQSHTGRDNPDQFEDVLRLIHAAESVMAKLPIENERNS